MLIFSNRFYMVVSLVREIETVTHTRKKRVTEPCDFATVSYQVVLIFIRHI